MEKTAPTASKNSKMLLLAMAPNLGWTILCRDVKAAFLSGATFDREIIVKLPRGCGPRMGVPSVDEEKNEGDFVGYLVGGSLVSFVLHAKSGKTGMTHVVRDSILYP